MDALTVTSVTGTGASRSPTVVLPGSGHAAAPTPPVVAVLPGAGAHSTDSSNREAAERAQKQVEAYLQAHDQSLRFNVDKASGLTVVHVLNTSTGEVVRQIPTEVVVRIAQFLKDEQPLVDTEA